MKSYDKEFNYRLKGLNTSNAPNLVPDVTNSVNMVQNNMKIYENNMNLFARYNA